MAAIKQLAAVARSGTGKGAARFVRREGRVPAVIYGGGVKPEPISVGFRDVNKLIFAGHFLTTIFELEIEGRKERVLPRDYQLDVVTDWPISLTPAGLALLQPLALFRTQGASIGWAIINLGFIGLSMIGLRRVLDSACGPRRDALFSWAAVLFVLLAAASIQVGQFSVLFATCWILFVSAFAGGSYFSAGMLLAIPTAIKLYPVMMLAVPMSLARRSS